MSRDRLLFEDCAQCSGAGFYIAWWAARSRQEKCGRCGGTGFRMSYIHLPTTPLCTCTDEVPGECTGQCQSNPDWEGDR